MKLSLIQMNSAGEPDENLVRACDLVDQVAEAESPDLIVLPEFFNTIYFAQYWDNEYMDLAEPDDGPTIEAMRERARAHRCHIVATIFELESAGIYYDTAILIDPEGEIAGKYRKVQPAAVQSLEKLFFRYGSSFPVFRVGEWRVGINICYDTFFPESARCTALNGADLIVVPFAAPKQALWRDVMRTRAFDNGVWFAPCNKVGTEREWTFPGGSMIIDPRGEVVSEAGEEEETISADIELDAVRQTRVRYPMFRDRRPDLYTPICTPTEDIPRVP